MPTSLIEIVKARKLKLFGHVARMNDNRILKMATFGIVEGSRSRGRPPRRWVDDITDWCHLDLHTVMTMALERNMWKQFTTSPDGQIDYGMKKKKNDGPF